MAEDDEPGTLDTPLTRREYTQKKAELEARLAALERAPIRPTLQLPYVLVGLGLAVAVVLLARHYGR